MTTREATHAGSWYEKSASKLSNTLDGYIDAVPEQLVGIGSTIGEPVPRPIAGARAIIAPYVPPPSEQ